MPHLSTTDAAKLAKMLGMLGSSHAGERDAAGLAVNSFIRARGLTWPQVLRPPAVEKPLPEVGTWRAMVAQCLAKPGSLRPWEIGFLRDLPGFRRISTKQRYILREIADRVLGAGRT